MRSTRVAVVSTRRLWFLALLGLLSLHSAISSIGSSSSSSSGTLPRSQSIPRTSSSHRRRDGYNNQQQPWNPSTAIDEAGFLKGLYVRTPGEWEEEVKFRTASKLDAPCRIRQVPGDGNCLFHSISLCLCHAVNGTQWNLCSQQQQQGVAVPHGGTAAAATTTKEDEMVHNNPAAPTLEDLYACSRKLRAAAVACLRDSERKLFLQGPETLTAAMLVEAAAQQYHMTADDYCEAMTEDSVWGGGPEIVALCNLLRRPIHVYELAVAAAASDNPSSSSGATGCGTAGFVLRRMACFGSPRFDRKPALHILSADSRFPDIRPGQQLTSGNHFLAVFPNDDDDACRNGKRKWLRGGDSVIIGDDASIEVQDSDSAPILLIRRAASQCISWWTGIFGNM